MILPNGSAEASSAVRTAALTSVAMLAFAANSLLCRAALGGGLIDAASFSTVRVASGAVVLAAIMRAQRTKQQDTGTSWRGVASLLVYMVCFSFAYLSLNAGTGALILFAAVQFTMFVVALNQGERFSSWSWIGFATAVLGLVYLISPGIEAPDPLGAVLMVVAGVGWGMYSLHGRKAVHALRATAANFIVGVPFVLLISALFVSQLQLSWLGVVLAAASGGVASGLGYAVWYAALRGLAATQAATVQLSVPVLAALGGVVMLAEPMSLRLAVSAAATLGGVAIVLLQRAMPARLNRR